jgi:hypothetical protein
MKGIISTIIISCIAVVLLSSPSPAQSYLYTYTGNPYNYASGYPLSPSNYHMTIEFTYDGNLTPNTKYDSIPFTMSDGEYTLSSTDDNIIVPYFEINEINSDGLPLSWSIILIRDFPDLTELKMGSGPMMVGGSSRAEQTILTSYSDDILVASGYALKPYGIWEKSIVSMPCLGDLNHDGRMDMQDWLLFGKDWGRSNCTASNPCACDLNADGRCNMQDWLIFGQNWGRTDCPIQ